MAACGVGSDALVEVSADSGRVSPHEISNQISLRGTIRRVGPLSSRPAFPEPRRICKLDRNGRGMAKRAVTPLGKRYRQLGNKKKEEEEEEAKVSVCLSSSASPCAFLHRCRRLPLQF